MSERPTTPEGWPAIEGVPPPDYVFDEASKVSFESLGPTLVGFDLGAPTHSFDGMQVWNVDADNGSLTMISIDHSRAFSPDAAVKKYKRSVLRQAARQRKRRRGW